MIGICSGENNGCDDRRVLVDCDVCVNSSGGTVAGKKRGVGACVTGINKCSVAAAIRLSSWSSSDCIGCIWSTATPGDVAHRFLGGICWIGMGCGTLCHRLALWLMTPEANQASLLMKSESQSMLPFDEEADSRWEDASSSIQWIPLLKSTKKKEVKVRFIE